MVAVSVLYIMVVLNVARRPEILAPKVQGMNGSRSESPRFVLLSHIRRLDEDKGNNLADQWSHMTQLNLNIAQTVKGYEDGGRLIGLCHMAGRGPSAVDGVAFLQWGLGSGLAGLRQTADGLPFNDLPGREGPSAVGCLDRAGTTGEGGIRCELETYELERYA